MRHLAVHFDAIRGTAALFIALTSQLNCPRLLTFSLRAHAHQGGTAYCNGGPIMTDTNGPGGLVMTTPLVRGDHLCRGTV